MRETLSKNEIDQFIQDGFIRIDHAFPLETAEKIVDTLWKDLPYDRSNPASWVEPVIRLGMYTQPPFIDSMNSKLLHTIFDQLVGKNKWLPCQSVGTFPVRFPSSQEPNDVGKHVDAGFPGSDPGNFFEWRVNVKSRGRALLMLPLYSDVSIDDAPTVIYKGSHIDVAQLLSQEEESGLSFMDLAGRLEELPKRERAYATGKAGTVYLCHPFLVHSGQAHKGTSPKFMAQPPLILKGEFSIPGDNVNASPVERAIRLGLKL